MATDFPGSLDEFTNPAGDDQVDTVDHAAQHANANDAIEALQAKVGANGSEVETSHDYKLSGVPIGDKAASKTGEETLVNKTLTDPIVNNPSTTNGTFTDPDIDGGSHDDGSFVNPVLSGEVQMNLGADGQGDVYYRDESGNLVRLPIGEDGQQLQVAGGAPAWQTPTSTSTDIVVSAYLSANITPATTPSKVNFNAENFDPSDTFATGTFVAPENGYYLISARLIFVQSSSSSLQKDAYIYKNGSAIARSSVSSEDGGEAQTADIVEIIHLAADDTIEVYAATPGESTASILGTAGHSSLNVCKL